MTGQNLKQYTVEELLGKGGMGEVYRARDNRLRRPVALKVLGRDLTADPERRRRFLHEARSASAVVHPSIAQIYDVDEVDGVIFIAMELIEGKTVRQLVQHKELDLLGAVEIGIQVGEGLGKAHQAGIVHRDIKSENISVTRDGHAKILDFGLAKPITSSPVHRSSAQAGDQLSQIETMVKTQVGTVVGTIAYMSPEQARGRPLDHRSDLFSMGVVLYEMVTGQLPFAGESLLDTMHAIAFEETRPVTALKENLPPELQRIIARCLRKKPEERYPDAKQLVSDLRHLKRDLESGITRAVPLRDKIRDGVDSLRDMTLGGYAAAIVLTLGLLLVLYLLFGSGRFDTGGLFVLGLVGMLVYRRMRNRRHRLLKAFVAKAIKMPEVQLVYFRDDCATVIVDQAKAMTYIRLNALMESINRKLFFGKEMSTAVRDKVPPDELRGILQGSGVLYVRDDVLE